jgi:hypothetical protein
MFEYITLAKAKEVFRLICPTFCLRQAISSSAALGFSSLRMVPKLKSMRFITNMGRRTANGVQTLSINQQLMNLFQVLTFEKV